jgi:hypothetical protein
MKLATTLLATMFVLFSLSGCVVEPEHGRVVQERAVVHVDEHEHDHDHDHHCDHDDHCDH